MGFRCSRWTRHVVAFVFAVGLPSIARAQAVVRGVLYDDASGTLVRGSVMLIDPQSNAAVAYTATDSAGGFTLQVKDGVYQIGAVRPGYVSVLSAPVPLQSGERLTIRVPIAQFGDPEHRIGVTEHVRPLEELGAGARVGWPGGVRVAARARAWGSTTIASSS